MTVSSSGADLALGLLARNNLRIACHPTGTGAYDAPEWP